MDGDRTGGDDQLPLAPEDVLIDFGDKVRKGYDPAKVDAHLRRIAAGVSDLAARVDSSSPGDDESLELVLQATRRSVDEALSEARTRAEQIVADAEARADQMVTEAETKAVGTMSDAQAEAERVLDDARFEARREREDAATATATMERESKERIAEIERLSEVREVELAALDTEIAGRQAILRDAATDLVRLADGFAESAGGDEDPAEATEPSPAPSPTATGPDDQFDQSLAQAMADDLPSSSLNPPSVDAQRT